MQINSALSQSNSTRWVAVLLGLFGMASTGRTLSKVLVTTSCLAWRLPMKSKASMRVVGAIVGLIAGIGLVATIVNRIRTELGVGRGDHLVRGRRWWCTRWHGWCCR